MEPNLSQRGGVLTLLVEGVAPHAREGVSTPPIPRTAKQREAESREVGYGPTRPPLMT